MPLSSSVPDATPARAAPAEPGSAAGASPAPGSKAGPRSGPRTGPALRERGPGDRPRRVALVGCGFIAEYHLDALAELGRDGSPIEVVAVVDPARSRAEALARRRGIPHALGSLDELDTLGVEVAHVLAPPDRHGSLVRALLERGIGVLCEKPLVLDSKEARALAHLAEARRLPLGTNQNSLYHPAFARLLERVKAGAVGRVEHVQITLAVPLIQLDANEFSHWMFRAPRNVVFEQAVHPLAQAHALLGRVRELETTLLGTRELLPGQHFHDRWAAAGRGERGTLQLYLSFGEPFTRSTLQVLGTDGALEADLAHDALGGESKTIWLEFFDSFLASWRRGGALRRDALSGLWRYGAFTLGLARRRDAFYVGMRDSIAAFHCALDRGEPPPVDAERAAEVLEWCEALAARADEAPPPAAPYPEAGPARTGEVLVLGASGFIGRSTVARLAEAGLPTSAVVRRRHGLPTELDGPARAGALRLVDASLEDPAALVHAVRGARVVLHLATGGGESWEAIERSMLAGTRALAEACLTEKVERLVYVSSVSALDSAGTRPLEDDCGVDPRARAGSGARSLYAAGKAEAERLLLALHRERGLPVTIVRPGIVVGRGTPLQHSGLGLWVRDNHCVGWGRGEHALPFVWVEDVADALVRLARHEGGALDGKALNLCAAPPLSAREALQELSYASGRRLEFHPRALALSQALEIGKWLVKKLGRRPGAVFPSWHDLACRALATPVPSRRAREVLGWRPLEESEAFVERALAPMARPGVRAAPERPARG